ncbi:hypothetical cyanophage protein [Synechococcus phage S-CRM01]|uniref:hypothetical cyanophage protein n=1 Tax=Synechococcus phage S-CRM01 TaxID=1026955 RepID=UPI000209E3AF|nr:hypothetical cyanophage protein [Synechococcus phage S-CRM01]AEC53061.1 hypothetical cyanophage protein [Synechococcus phage S-CRM01]
MNKPRYRGIEYDSETHKKEFLDWKRKVSMIPHVYRGVSYYPIRTMSKHLKKMLYKIMK